MKKTQSETPESKEPKAKVLKSEETDSPKPTKVLKSDDQKSEKPSKILKSDEADKHAKVLKTEDLPPVIAPDTVVSPDAPIEEVVAVAQDLQNTVLTIREENALLKEKLAQIEELAPVLKVVEKSPERKLMKFDKLNEEVQTTIRKAVGLKYNDFSKDESLCYLAPEEIFRLYVKEKGWDIEGSQLTILTAVRNILKYVELDPQGPLRKDT